MSRTGSCTKDLKEKPDVRMVHDLVALAVILTLVAPACAGPTPQPTAAPAVSHAGTEHAAPTDGMPDLSDADVTFLDRMADIADGYAATFASLDEHIDLVIDDSSLFDDEAWLGASAEILDEISLLNRQVRSMDPPPRCERVHARLLEAADRYETFVALYGQGLEELDGEKIDQAIDEMIAGTETIHDATERIDELLE